MRPKLLLPVRSIFKDWLLPENIVRELEESFELEVAVDPAELSKNEYVELYRGRDAVLTTWNTPFLDREVIGAMDRLKIISHCGGEVRPFLGPDIFELKPDLLICNASNVMAKPVAEHTLTVTLCLLRSLLHFKEWVRFNENWWEYDPHKNVSLLQKKVGIVGLGQIAWEFIKLVRPFDVELLVYSSHLTEEEARKEKLVKAGLEEIFSTCDVITLSAAAVKTNRHMINRHLLRMIKPGAVLVNNARGMLIDEQALVEELRTGRFSAAIDVTDPEPPAAGHPLRDMPNVLLTPHTGGPVPHQRHWMMEEAVCNLKAFFSGGKVRGIIDKKRFSYMA